jgi:hypothetical protein
MTELTEQIRRGDEVLGSQAGLHASCASGGPWVADSTLDASALAALSQLGYNELVIPPSAVTGPSLATTPTRRFTLTGTPATTSAILSDPQLSYLLQETAATDPGLAADQFLAELEFDYTEWPNTADPRGVVAAPPADWHADPTVLADVLAGLQDNPMVEPVTLSTLFADVPVGGTVGRFIQPSNHRPAAVSSATGFPAQAIATARAQLAGFTDSVSETPAGSAVATNLSDLLLESESRQLTAAQQRAAVVGFEQAIGKQLALLSITSRDARLTARTGSVPITVIKNAPYPVVAVLTLTSDKISFSAGGAQVPNAECRKPVVTTTAGTSRVSTQCTFIHGTNAVYIEMRSRVSGRFRMAVTLDSPATDLQLASGQLTVQSMSTSAVAIALSVAAIAVLLTWWGRTMWRTRKTRRGAHAQGADHS